jgi:deoxyribodipyrimidine photo-lyase
VGAAVCLFTRDLRVRDNPALAAAAAVGTVIPLFVLDDAIPRSFRAPNRERFLLESLADLDRSLRALGTPLLVRTGDWAGVALATADEGDAREIHVARDVSGYAQRRLARLRAGAARADVAVVEHDSHTVVPPGSVQPSGGGPYRVFTPYHRRWRVAAWRAPLGPPERLVPAPGIDASGASLADAARSIGPCAPDLAPGGETAGLARARAFTRDHLAAYDRGHDDLAADATSRLSPYLHFGCVSALELAARLVDRPGGEPFTRQLCWRDFYAQLLAAHPRAAHDDLRPGAPPWAHDPAAFDAWRTGRTGFPLVDAGMRQLRHEGWMHNRARMVVASFLTKDLLVDWRLGAAHFLAHLVDGDLAQNQLNWQWVAGTGTDTSPHRVLNPTVQGRRFDPTGAYVRRYVVELAAVEGDVHDPPSTVRASVGYPEPVVDHPDAVERWRAARRA